MSPKLSLAAAALFVAAATLPAGPAPGRDAFPSFEKKELDTSLRVGYAVLVADIDGDGRQDIVVVDATRVVWYQNPTWKRRVITEGVTKPDNVSAAAYDIDGDGQLDLALAADWRPFDTKSGGTLQWLRRGKTLDEPWTVFPIGEEPTLHRVRFAPLGGSGKHALIAAPLMGRNSSAKNNWTDGSPVRLLAYRIPKDPARDRWVPEVIDESLHVLHNFLPVSSWYLRSGSDFLTASYEGVSILNHTPPRWTPRRLGAGNQENPAGSRGASEVRWGWLKGSTPLQNATPFIAAVEPWHGHQLVVYTPGADRDGPWERRVLDDRLKWGHALWCADLDGDGSDEIVLGVRDNLSGKPGERCGVRVYRATGGRWKTWERHLIDEGGVAVEDLTAADLDGDGRMSVVAVGRQTHNLVIYRNAGKK